MSLSLIIEIITILGFIGAILGVTYKLGQFSKVLENSVSLGTMTYNEVMSQSERIDENATNIEMLEETKLDKDEFNDFLKDFIKLQTEHEIGQKGD